MRRKADPRTCLAALLLVLCLVPTALARIITVDDDGPADFNNIQAVINDANDGDTVEIQPGLYTGPGNRNIDFKGKAITVRSTDPNDPNIVAATVIDCNSLGQAFYFHSGETPESRLEGVTGTRAAGSSIYFYGAGAGIPSHPTIRNCVFKANSGSLGGALHIWRCSPRIINCTFSDNTATEGGAIHNTEESHSYIENCSFVGNVASLGGAICTREESHARITSCSFVSNLATDGGAICDMEKSHSYIDNCSFVNNSASRGGALANYNRNYPVITNCVFVSNSAEYGGAVRNNGHGDPTIVNCLFNHNSASKGGVIFSGYLDAPVLLNCTLSRNTANKWGGGIYNEDCSTVTLSNCVLWGNTDQTGTNELSQIRLTTYPIYPPAINYSCIQGLTGALGGEGNIGLDPLFVDANGPDNLAGTEDDNLRLSLVSPCVDAGDNSAPLTSVIFDLDGNPRRTDAPSAVDTGNGEKPIVDMGAYEYLPPGTPVIGLSDTEYKFIAVEHGPNPENQPLTIWNRAEGVLNWTVTNDCDWLQVFPSEGISTGLPGNITISADVTGLAQGMYTCAFSIFDPNTLSVPRNITVNLDVKTPVIGVDPNRLYFICLRGDPIPKTQTLLIWNADVGTLNWQISEDCDWLDVSPTSGQSSGEVDQVIVCVDGNGLDIGDYTCELFVSDPNADNSPVPVTVNVHVGTPVIELGNTPVQFEYRPGDPNPPPKEFYIRNSDIAILNWQVTEDCDWLNISPATGQSTGEKDYVQIDVDPNGLSPGRHAYNLVVTDPNARNSPQWVSVSLYVDGPVIDVTPNPLSFVYSPDIPGPNSQTIAISNASIQTLHWSISEDCNWLSLWPLSGTSRGEPNDVIVTIDWAQITGDHSANLTISDPNSANKAVQVAVVVHCTETSVLRVPSIFPTIQSAVQYADDGDTVVVDPGIYTGPGNRNIDFNGRAITVRSTDPNNPNVVATTVIDCNGLGRGFYFHNEEDGNSVLTGFTITNGYAKYGGGIYCAYSGPSISNCVIVGNTAYGYPGGGGVCGNEDDAAITDCTIVRNTTPELGGGVYLGRSKAQVVGCRISGNSAGRDGGGVYTSHGWSEIRNCLIVGNRASEAGGAICNWGRSPTIESSTICHNVALGFAGGIISTYGSETSVLNCVIRGNFGYPGPELAVAADDGVESTLSVSYSNVEGTRDMVHIAEGCTLNWGPGNIDMDPCFAAPGYWGHSDDPNMHVEPNDPNAVWVHGDYHLKSQYGRWEPNILSWLLDDVTSLCIDAGDPNSDWSKELWPNGKHINLGAYGGTREASMSPTEIGNIADLDLDGFVYRTDLPLFMSQWLLGGQPLSADLTRNGFVDFPDLAVFGWHWKRPSPPLPANAPSPAEGTSGVALAPLLTWTSDANALWHDVYFGTASPGIFQICQPNTTFEPGLLDKNTWYYWRIDEINPGGVTTGVVWSFKTGSPPDPATEPNPPDGSVGIRTDPVLSWVAGAGATSHDVYFGKTSPGTFRGNQSQTTFTPGSLAYETTYYWRIDEVNAAGKTTGPVWSFTTKSSGTR